MSVLGLIGRPLTNLKELKFLIFSDSIRALGLEDKKDKKDKQFYF